MARRERATGISSLRSIEKRPPKRGLYCRGDKPDRLWSSGGGSSRGRFGRSAAAPRSGDVLLLTGVSRGCPLLYYRSVAPAGRRRITRGRRRRRWLDDHGRWRNLDERRGSGRRVLFSGDTASEQNANAAG